jgi:hypothetical protein
MVGCHFGETTVDCEKRNFSRNNLNILSILAATWIFFCLVDISLAIFADGTYLHDSKLSYWEQLLILLYNLIYITIILLITGFIIFLILTIHSRMGLYEYRCTRLISQIVLCCFICIILFLYFCSWGCFFGFGTFLNGDAIDF